VNSIINAIESAVFRYRMLVIFIFLATTVFLAYQSSQLKLDAGFTKNIPLQHEYMQNYMKHSKEFGGANSVLVAVCDKNQSIYNKEFFDTLKDVHDQLFFINGIDRSLVKSIYSSSTRFTEIVEGGFAGGPVIPADFNSSNPQALEKVASNIEKSGIVGGLISDDFQCAMVSAQLLELDPSTGEKLSTLDFAAELESR